MYWYSAIGLAYSAVTNRLPLILMVMSIKITFFDSFVDVHLSPIALILFGQKLEKMRTSGLGPPKMTFVLTSLFEKIPLCFSENPPYVFQKLFPALSDVRITF